LVEEATGVIEVEKESLVDIRSPKANIGNFKVTPAYRMEISGNIKREFKAVRCQWDERFDGDVTQKVLTSGHNYVR
jgi:hypothetical protein